jgi:hypothetical protein
MSPQVQPFCVSVLLHQDGNAWVAQCLEHDLAAQAPSKEEAKKRFLATLAQQILVDVFEGRTPLRWLPQAPPRYFEEALSTSPSGPELPVYVPAPPQEEVPRVRAQFFAQAAP